MRIEHELSPLIKAWLKRTRRSPYSAQQTVSTVMKQLAHTPQHRRRRWSLPWRKPSETTTPGDARHDLQPTPIATTSGHTPTAIGRTKTMFSPAKAAIVGAVVFAIGGALLVAQPFQQQISLPGATAPIAPTWVTGTIRSAPCRGSGIVWDGDIGHTRNAECSPQRWASSDPRLSGPVVRRWNDDIYQTDEDAIWVEMGAAYLRNDDGGWTCSSRDLLKGITTTGAGTTVEEEVVNGGTTTFDCVGDGGYEGLSALLVSKFTVGHNEEFSGLIFSGDFPPVPEPPAAK